MISPAEIDDVLHRCPGVELAAAVGAPHPIYGEEVVAFVVARAGAGLDAARLDEFCRAGLGPRKTPKRFHLVDDLPKGPSGKIQRRRLVERHLARGGRWEGT
jgi:long-chain acyl-CoA synthetase